MKDIELSSETQNSMLPELHKLFKLIWQKKKKCCDCKSWKYFFFTVWKHCTKHWVVRGCKYRTLL